MPVTVQTSGNYEISNGLVAVRVPTAFPVPLAPIQGLRHRDGTWVAAGHQLHRRSWYDFPRSAPDPLIGAETTILVNTPTKVTIEVHYTFDRPEFTFAGVTIPAGIGHHRTTITVLADEPVVMVKEAGDVDVGYSLNVYPGLAPNRARYRGWGATEVAAGRYPEGGLYRAWEEYRHASDATVDLDYGTPRSVSYAYYDSGNQHTRPALVLWSPWERNTGRYWQMFNSAAPSAANLFGIFSGPASHIVGGVASGAGVYHGPGDDAGVTVELNRGSPDSRVAAFNQFSWGMYFSTKADLPAEDQTQPIGLQQNRHGGLALKMAGYRSDFTDPTGGYGKLYMGQAAIAALKARVQGDFNEYQRAWNLDPTVRPLIDLWRNDDAASLQVVIDSIMEVANALDASQTTGDGIFDRSFSYFEGGQQMIRVALFIDQALAHPLATPAQKLEVKKAAKLFASVLWDDDFVPFSGAAQVGLGLANNQGQHQSYRDFYALYLGADAAWSTRANEVAARAISSFRYFVNESGAPNASTGYIAANLWPVLNVLMQVREMRGQDLLAAEPRAALLGDFLLNFMTPYEPRFGGWRKLVAVGDGSTESTQLHGVLATCLRGTPMAAKLMQAWDEMGSLHHGFFGSSLLMIDESAPRALFTLGNASFPGYLTVQRGREAGLESTLWMIDGHQYSDHRAPDQGMIALYGLGAPISIGFGSLYYPHVPGALWRSCAQPGSEWWSQADLPFDRGNAWWNSTAVPGEFEYGGQLWKRVAKLANVGGRHVLAVRDTSAQPLVVSLNLMAQGLVTPPTGAPFIPPLHPLAPITGSLPAGVYRWRCKGQWGGNDFDVWVAASAPFDWTWGDWKHYWHPGLEVQQFQQTNGYPFEEGQYTLRIRITGTVKCAVIPYPASTPWTGTVVDTPTGLGFTGGIQDVALALGPEPLTEVEL